MMKGFGERLRKLREERHLSQHELSQLVGIHLSQLSRIERGASFPSAETVLTLARALHTSTDALLRGENNGVQKLEIENVRLYERFRALETTGRDGQETVIKVIDAILAKERVEAALAHR